MVGNQVLGSFHHPGEVTDTGLVGLGQGGRQRQAGRIGKRLGLNDGRFGDTWIKPLPPQRFGLVKVEAEEVAVNVRHGLTF